MWLQFASRCKYMDRQQAIELDREYDAILGRLVTMCNDLDHWTIKRR